MNHYYDVFGCKITKKKQNNKYLLLGITYFKKNLYLCTPEYEQPKDEEEVFDFIAAVDGCVGC